MKQKVFEALYKCRLFNNADESTVREIADNYASLSVCEKNSVIFSETKYTRALVIIVKGKVSVTKKNGNGKILMSILGEGDIFGMATMFYEEENFLTEITALEKVTMLTVPKDSLVKLFSLYPIITENYIKILSERIHFLNKKISTYTKSETIQKTASLILQNCDSEKKISVLPYSITNAADALNIGRASVYRAFESLENSGYIKRNGRKIEILDSAALENM